MDITACFLCANNYCAETGLQSTYTVIKCNILVCNLALTLFLMNPRPFFSEKTSSPDFPRIFFASLITMGPVTAHVTEALDGSSPILEILSARFLSKSAWKIGHFSDTKSGQKLIDAFNQAMNHMKRGFRLAGAAKSDSNTFSSARIQRVKLSQSYRGWICEHFSHLIRNVALESRLADCLPSLGHETLL